MPPKRPVINERWAYVGEGDDLPEGTAAQVMAWLLASSAPRVVLVVSQPPHHPEDEVRFMWLRHDGPSDTVPFEHTVEWVPQSDDPEHKVPMIRPGKLVAWPSDTTVWWPVRGGAPTLTAPLAEFVKRCRRIG